VSEEIESAISSFIKGDLLDDGVDLEPDGPLLEGLLDSFALMSLVSYIEDNFDVTIDVDEVTKGNFASVRAIAGFVANKRQAA
jgi:acyl carrier protein